MSTGGDHPIRNKKLDLPTAPTPQNTPANAAPISSRAQAPDVSSIREEDIERLATASVFANNPAVVGMIQGRLSQLVGRSSGYIEALPAVTRRRVTGLKGVQKEHAKLEVKFQEEVLELEKRYFQKFKPLYEKRFDIVNGKVEPTDAEVEAGESEDEDEDNEDEVEGTKDKKTKDKAEDTTDPKDVPSGIPEFWLSAMKNQGSLAEMITSRDEDALKNLKDIRLEYLDRPGFRLIFDFGKNEHFSNSTITKTYYYQEESGYGGDFIYDHAEGDKIEWLPDKNLTTRTESKKQRNRNTNQTRIVKKTVPTESFFNFFSPPKPPGDEDESVDSDIEERLELDYQLGEDIKEKLIPRAIDWFTGEALKYEMMEDDLEEDFDVDDDEEDDDLSDDKDEDEETDDEEGPNQGKQEAAECKQT